jgi:predicted nucleotidyltransferase
MASQTIPTLDQVKETLLPVLRRHGVTRAGVFGSLIHGELKAESDIDLLVEIDQPISLLGLARINRELEEAIGRKVDLVEYHTIKPRIKQQILAEEVRIL